MDVFDQLDAPKKSDVFDELDTGLSGSLMGSEQTPAPEVTTLEPTDPRYEGVRTGVEAGQNALAALRATSQLDFSDAVPEEERLRQISAVEAERRIAEQRLEELSGVKLGDVHERLAGAQRVSELLRQERGLRQLHASLHARTEQGQREAFEAQGLYGEFQKRPENTPGVLATFAGNLGSHVANVSAAVGQAAGIEGMGDLRGEAAGMRALSEQRQGVPAQIARGAADVTALAAGLPAGRAGIVQGALRAGLDTYSSTLQQTGDANAAYKAAITTAPEMAAYLAVGAGAGKAVEALLPKNTGPMLAGLANFAGAEVANVGTSNVLRAIHNQDYDVSGLTADTLFAIFHGVGGYKGKVSEQARERARGELRERGYTEDQIQQKIVIGEETPASELKQPTGEPNAIQDRSATPIHGDVFDSIGSGQSPGTLPTTEGGEGILTHGQGEVVAEPARGEAPQEIIGIVPAIRAGDEVIRGEPGEEHKDILKRLRDTDVEKFLVAQETFGKDNFFVDPNGRELSRDQLEKEFGVRDSQHLREAQDAARRKLGPGAANIEEFPPPTTVGAKNASVDAQRAERGLPPLMSESRKTNPETWAAVEKRVETDPEFPRRVVDEIEKGEKKSITDEEQTSLLWRMVDLRNQRDMLDQRANDEQTYSPEERAQFEEQANAVEEDLQRTEEADRKIGTATGRALQIRKLMANEDYTLAAMERRARKSKGDVLTPEERATIKQQSEKIEETQKALEERTAKVEEEDAGKAVDETLKDIETEAAKDPEFTPEVKSLADRIIARLDKAADAALKRLRSKGFALGSAPDPTIAIDVAIYGAAKIGKGVIKFSRWAADMVKELGEGVKPYLQDAWKQIDKNIDDAVAKSTPDKTKRAKVKAAVTKEDATAAAEAIGTDIKTRLTGGEKLGDLRGNVNKLVETLVRGGVKGREAVVDAVHEVLKSSDATITRRQTMDLISGYGDFKQLNKDAVKAEVRDIKQQLQLVAKIQDVQNRIPLVKSGVERQRLSDESRRLTAELNENIKKFGVKVSDPAKQLRTMLAAQETRLTNRIKDLRAELAAGERRVKSQTAPPTNERIAALKKELAEVEAEHKKVFGDRKATDEQKLNAALTTAKRAEAAEQVRLEKAKRGVFDKPIKTSALRSAELDAIKARTEAAREDRKALEKLANPPLSDAQKRLDAALVAKERWQQVLAGEIAPAKKLPREALTQLEEDARAEIAAMRELAAEIKRDERPKTDPEIAQVKALEKAAAEYERRLNAADFSGKGKTHGPDTARVAAARALRDAAKKAFDAAREATKPKRTPEETALQTAKAALARRNADLADKLAKGDFAKRERKPLDISKDPEAVRLKAENARLKREFEKKRFEDEQRRRHWLRKGADAVKETLAASRSLITSADVSAPLRQGGFLLIGDLFFHPVRVAKQLGTMFRQLASEKEFQRAQAEISLRPNADLYAQSKLYFSDMDGKLSAREENMRSSLTERIPGIGRIVRASNRAYSGFLNRQRADAFDAMVEARGGKDTVSPEGAKLIADAVNTLTGRGSTAVALGSEQAANALSRYLFSPRFLASRFQTVLGHPIFGALGKGASARDRAIIAKQYVKFAAGLAAIYGLAQLAGGKVEKDARSSDFGKIRIGDTRIDPLAGLAQVTTLMARVGTQKVKKQGEVKPLTADTYYQFARGKLAPIPATFVDVTTGKNVIGEKVTTGSALRGLVTPISYQDMGKIYRDQGGLKGTVINMLNLLGAGVQSYKK